MPLGIRMFLAVDFDVGNIARRPIGDESHHVVNAGNSIALSRYICYLNTLK